jgi:LacI family transcriptional regulator
LLRQGLDGVIHASVGEDEDVLLSLIRDRRRMVFTNRRPTDDALSYVVSDNSEGARVLTEHLLQQGHRRIGFVNGPAYARNAIERLEGFRRAMARTADPQIFVVEGDFSLDSGRRAVAEWCQLPEPPSAVIAVNDTVALGVRESLAERGLRVPEDVALAGFDGVQLAASPILNLTTVDQHIDRLGQRAVQILLRQLADDGPLRPVQEVVPTQLLVRKSTQAPPRHERPARRRASPDDRRRLAVTDSTAKPRPW